jgi:hypothetical protein
MARCCVLAAAAALLGAAPAVGQGAPREIGPGSPGLRPDAVRERTDTLDMLAPQGGTARAVAMVVLRTSAGERPGVLLRVERVTGADGEIFARDSFVVERATLAPVAAHGWDGTDTRALRWEEGRMRGLDADETIDRPIGAPSFYANSVDMVLAALPLAEGFEALVRFSGGEAADGPVPVHVSAREEVATADGGRCPAWRVEVGGSGHSGSYWIGADDRALVRFDAEGGRIRIVRRNGCAAAPGGRATR